MGVGRYLSWGTLGEVVGLGRGQQTPPHHFRCTKIPENASSGRKCRLVAVSWLDSADHMDVTGRTPGFFGTLVEKHWSKLLIPSLYLVRLPRYLVYIALCLCRVRSSLAWLPGDVILPLTPDWATEPRTQLCTRLYRGTVGLSAAANQRLTRSSALYHGTPTVS